MLIFIFKQNNTNILTFRKSLKKSILIWSWTLSVKYFLYILFFPPFGLISQRAIEAQVEEKRRQREQERAMKRREEEEEERRVSLERQILEKQYKMDIVKEKQVRNKH